jgi:hypothetical protein
MPFSSILGAFLIRDDYFIIPDDKMLSNQISLKTDTYAHIPMEIFVVGEIVTIIEIECHLREDIQRNQVELKTLCAINLKVVHTEVL